MKGKHINIRAATSLDRADIHSVHWSAFAEGEREIVSELAVNLLSEETAPPVISLVAETEGTLVGHVAFSPVTFDSDTECLGYILSPLAIRPSHQKRRIGSQIVESGMQQLSNIGVKILFVYGDPKYYGRFGFSEDVARPYVPPYQLEFPFGWQGIFLNDYSTEESFVRIACVSSLRDPSLW